MDHWVFQSRKIIALIDERNASRGDKRDAAPVRSDLLRCFEWCLFALLILFSGTVASQTTNNDQLPPKPLRFDVTPLIGYRTSMSFPTGPPEEPTPSLVLDATPSYGIAAGVRRNEEDVIEFRWTRQDSRVHLEGTQGTSRERAVLDQFHGDFTHEYFLDDWPVWARPYVIGSVGATHVGVKTGGSFTRFSFGLGAGVKFYFSRHFGFRIQGEWLPVLVNPEVNSFVCGGGCRVHLSGTLVSQGEVVVGPLFRF